MACMPKKCATRRSPPSRAQPKIGRPPASGRRAADPVAAIVGDRDAACRCRARRSCSRPATTARRKAGESPSPPDRGDENGENEAAGGQDDGADAHQVEERRLERRRVVEMRGDAAAGLQGDVEHLERCRSSRARSASPRPIARLPTSRRQIGPEPGQRQEIERDRGLELQRLRPDVDAVERARLDRIGEEGRSHRGDEEEAGPGEHAARAGAPRARCRRAAGRAAAGRTSRRAA